MTQDTRKDQRAKIVSLNVRYKSATVDEFIDNHSHDVSKGGIYIKTPTPFAAGTLIKFEIRIAGDKAVIAGVGRVVWKREAGQASADRPAGMGVKFIKIDESSRQVIDRIVGEKAEGAQSAYDSEDETGSIPRVPVDAHAPPPFDPKMTPPPLEGAVRAERPDRPRPQHKSTMMGIGTNNAAGASRAPRPDSGNAAAAAAAAAARGGGGMFPATNSEGDMPPKPERTVMKQAAELLEEALKEAGGSMADIGSNPLFAAAQPSPIIEPPPEVPKTTLIGMPAAQDVSVDRLETAPRASGSSSESLRREASTAAAVAKNVSSGSMRPAPSRGFEREDESASRQRKTEPPSRARSQPTAAAILAEEPSRSSRASAPEPKKSGGSALAWVGILAVLLVAGGVFAYKTYLAPAPKPAAVVPVASTSASASPSATAAEGAEPAESATSTPTALDAQAAAMKDATAIAADAAPASTAHAPSTTTAPTTTATAPTAPTTTPVTTPTTVPAVTATATAPTSRPTSTAAPTATATPAPAPKPRPKPKPTAEPQAPDDDNPY